VATYDQFGEKLPLIFYDNGYDVVYDLETDDSYSMPGASVEEEQDEEDSDTLYVTEHPGQDIGHVALYAAYLYCTEGCDVWVELREEIELFISADVEEPSIPAPHMSPEEIEERFSLIDTDEILEPEKELKITRIAGEIIVRRNMLRKQDSVSHEQNE